MEIDEMTIEGVCRTCLCTSNDTIEALEELNFDEICGMLNKTFGKIVNIDKISNIFSEIFTDVFF